MIGRYICNFQLSSRTKINYGSSDMIEAPN